VTQPQTHTECPTSPSGPNLSIEYGKMGMYGGAILIGLVAVMQGAAIMKMLVRRVAFRGDVPEQQPMKKRSEKNP
jgi:hypothetical protein